ncbi:hypothetical protein HPP92_020719 [Vanilla planifolia]|uniref:Rapid alkalinization factor n=1 Tax=Vanilla planifolia TaxID=51239 RepID=A0A835Q471_VANPL|nr:hypothetical protein HPP92_021088 [Vanilla planifolia]KAG0462243.1 hypothetical protein HPP92_020719 [Vanilla planifolia]
MAGGGAALLILLVIAGCLVGDGRAGRYINYDPLRKDTVPCSKRSEAQMNNCRPQPAEPYERGCSKLEMCRGGAKVEEGGAPLSAAVVVVRSPPPSSTD